MTREAADHDGLVAAILSRRRATAASRATLVALTGIDGCGKGFVAAALNTSLCARGLRVASLNLDGWLNLPHVRFSSTRQAEHFYRHAIRFDALFDRLVLPLQARRSVDVTMDFVDETSVEYRPRRCRYSNVDVVVLEGIYLLKRELHGRYDLSCWVDCSFETALERAIGRSQEGLSPEDTVRVYETIYFPAQRIHFERDRPRDAADLVLQNDPGRASTSTRPALRPACYGVGGAHRTRSEDEAPRENADPPTDGSTSGEWFPGGR